MHSGSRFKADRALPTVPWSALIVEARQGAGCCRVRNTATGMEGCLKRGMCANVRLRGGTEGAGRPT